MINAIVNEVLDYDWFLCGKNREAMFTGMVQCFWKLMRLPSEVIPFVLLAYLGYDPNKE